jgi:hypothetical protein
VHFVGDALSARGISVSGAHGTLVAEQILSLGDAINNFLNDPINNQEPHEMGDTHKNLIGGLTMPKKNTNKLSKKLRKEYLKSEVHNERNDGYVQKGMMDELKKLEK